MSATHGYQRVTLSSVDEFKEALNYMVLPRNSFVYRGHRDSDWRLLTTLDRLMERLSPHVRTDGTYEFMLELFVKAIRGRSNVVKDIVSNNDELWALGQHHGLATPLLDWSRSFYVALFFAFSDPAEPNSGFRSVWALSDGKSMKNKMIEYNKGRDYDEHFGFVDPVSDTNPRLIAQSGLFTKQPLGFSMINWVQEIFKDDGHPYLIEYLIPSGLRVAILSHLMLMNIHSGTLFPDLVGASLHCNEKIKLLAHASHTPPIT